MALVYADTAVAGRAPTAGEHPPTKPRSDQTNHYALGYLRAVITLLVVAHHAVIAYNPFAPLLTSSLVEEPRWWKAFPVVDEQRSVAWLILNAFNDGFFMALMFFISGLFVWASLQRNGSGQFIRDRARRLGIPFVVAAGLIAPLAYYPAYLQRTTDPSVGGFVGQWLSTIGAWAARWIDGLDVPATGATLTPTCRRVTTLAAMRSA